MHGTFSITVETDPRNLLDNELYLNLQCFWKKYKHFNADYHRNVNWVRTLHVESQNDELQKLLSCNWLFDRSTPEFMKTVTSANIIDSLKTENLKHLVCLFRKTSTSEAKQTLRSYCISLRCTLL